MPLKTLIIAILFSLCYPFMGYAQTACWLLKPDFQCITPFGESYYKANTYSKMAVYDNNGNSIVEADSITYITNGYALALNVVNGRYRLISIIDKSGNVRHISDEYYVDEHHFFSEDLLGVCNKKGKYGYINPDGKLEIPCQYVAVHPFREGFASVSKPKKGLKGLIGSSSNKKSPVGSASYINHKGIELNIHSGKNLPILATSFKNGQGLVQMEDGNTFYVDTKGNRIGEGPNTREFELDDYYAYSEEGEKPKVNLPFEPMYNTAYTISTEGSLKGYVANGIMMVPTQFQEAYGFASGFAIVKKNDKFGILKQLSGSVDFKVGEKGGKISASGSIPAEWDNSQAKFVRITNGTERLSFVMNGKDRRRMVTGDVPINDGEKIYEVDVDGLVIWRQTGAAVAHLPQGSISIKAPSKISANTKGVCIVNVRVTNNSDSTQSIVVSLSTGGSKSIKLGAGKSGSVSITAKVSKETKCIVTAKSSLGNASCTTNLVPSFVL